MGGGQNTGGGLREGLNVGLGGSDCRPVGEII